MNLLVSNKNNYLIVGIVFFVFLFALEIALTPGHVSTYQNVNHIAPSEAYRLIDSGDALVLDVRGRDAFENAHIPGAIAVPVGSLKNRLGEFEAHKTDNIVVYCNDGVTRGPAATAMLNNAGFAGAKNLKGGLGAWRANSYHTVAVN